MSTLIKLALTLITVAASVVVVAFFSDVTGISLLSTGSFLMADTPYFKPITISSFAILIIVYLYGHVHLKNKEQERLE